MRSIVGSFTEILICLSPLLAVCIVSTSFAENEIPYGSGFASKEAGFMIFPLNSVEYLKIGTGEQTMGPNPNRSFDFTADPTPQSSPESTNSFPSASISFPPWNETTLSLGGVIGFVASVTGGNPPLTYLWDFDGGAKNSAWLDPGFILFGDPGTFNVTFSVTDADGDQDSDLMVVKVEGVDKIPLAKILSPTEDVTITAGQSVYFAAEAQDGNPPLSYEWDFQGKVEFYTGTFSFPGRVRFPEPGIYTVTFAARDMDNDYGRDTVKITVNPVDVDTKPVINMISPESDLTIEGDGTIMFFSLVHGGNPPFEYEWNFDGAAEGYFKDYFFENPPRPILFDQAGIYNVTFTVTDADGETDRILRVITVEPAVRQKKPKPVSIDISPVDPVHATTLQVEPFVHSADGYIHAATRWQISERDDFFALTLDIESQTFLTQIPLPVVLLKPETGYFWRTKFFDDKGNESEWSDAATFVTGARDDDANANGISDPLEVNESVDLDHNGRPDREQEEIKCIHTAESGTIAGVTLPSHAGFLEALQSVDPDFITGKDNRQISFPIGLIAFRADTAIFGQTVEITIHLNQPLSDDIGWFEFNGMDGWSDFSDHVVSREEGRTITLNLRDGGIGDADGTMNGTIVHSSGPGMPLAEIYEPNRSSGSGCFITAGSQ